MAKTDMIFGENKAETPKEETPKGGTGNGKDKKKEEQKDTSQWDNPRGEMEYWGDGNGVSTQDEVVCTPKGNYVQKAGTINAGSYDISYAGVTPEHLYSAINRKEIGDTDKDLNSALTQYDEKSGNDLKIYLPNYGVSDFVNERALWQKGTYDTLGEQGWFYFKIFFNFFDSKLFSGFLDIYGNETFLLNTSALRYLYGIRNFYGHDRILDRILALSKFVNLLSYINTAAPWFFKSISNISKLNSLGMTELTKDKYITIQCNPEAIDMRLNTLFDLYRFACYDDIYKKEIIPENLRKFDMQILIMNVPLKYFQTAFLYANEPDNLGGKIVNSAAKLLGKMNTIGGPINKVASFIAGNKAKYYDFKQIDNSHNDFMSFQLFTLKNCEFVINDSLEGYYNGNLSNESFFNLGSTSIKIKYDNVYKHSYNEWENIFFGSTTFDADLTNETNVMVSSNIPTQNMFLKKLYEENKRDHGPIKQKRDIARARLSKIQTNLNNIFFTPGTQGIYKSLIDFSEKTIKDALIGITNPYWLGNIGDPNVITMNSTLNKLNKLFGVGDRLTGGMLSAGVKDAQKWMNKKSAQNKRHINQKIEQNDRHLRKDLTDSWGNIGGNMAANILSPSNL